MRRALTRLVARYVFTVMDRGCGLFGHEFRCWIRMGTATRLWWWAEEHSR